MLIEHRGDWEKDRRRINRKHAVNSKTIKKNFINLSSAGDGENWKQAVKMMAKGGNDNASCKENHGELRHILSTLYLVMIIWTHLEQPVTLRHL